VTSNGGLILVRELDERLGLEKLIEEHLSDSRQGLNKQFTLADRHGSSPSRTTVVLSNINPRSSSAIEWEIENMYPTPRRCPIPLSIPTPSGSRKVILQEAGMLFIT